MWLSSFSEKIACNTSKYLQTLRFECCKKWPHRVSSCVCKRNPSRDPRRKRTEQGSLWTLQHEGNWSLKFISRVVPGRKLPALSLFWKEKAAASKLTTFIKIRMATWRGLLINPSPKATQRSFFITSNWEKKEQVSAHRTANSRICAISFMDLLNV